MFKSKNYVNKSKNMETFIQYLIKFELANGQLERNVSNTY